MDFVKLRTGIKESFGKYKYVWIVLLAGILLMLIPQHEKDNTEVAVCVDTKTQLPEALSRELESILCKISGAGEVKVMLSISEGERTIYQTDSSYRQDQDNTDTKTQTVVISDNQRNEHGLIHQINPPGYQGAIIVAQGGDIPSVKLAIVEAVSNVTGLGADKIAVLKMQ